MVRQEGPKGRSPRAPQTGPPQAIADAAAPRGGACPPVIAIGTSAGGLAALESFLEHMPPHAGVAIVIIQHLDPTRKGMLVELLQPGTSMPVLEVIDGTSVEPDKVYVIPPNKDLLIMHGILELMEPTAARGLRLPIDTFFRALAEDQHERAIGVILSGMGSDGTLGLKAIKGEAGASFVQSPESAEFNAMPQSAISAAVADVVAPVEELPARILAYLGHTPILPRTDPEAGEPAENPLEKIFLLLRSQTGHDFSAYKGSTVRRRVDRRMGLHGVRSLPDYVRFLQENPQEIDLLFKELLIGVTSFFRDREAWDSLKNHLAAYVHAHPNQMLRAWVAGCSTGEEAYSLAIAFREVAAQVANGASLQVFATDIDPDAVARARSGTYPVGIAADVSPERLERFFHEEEGGYRVRRDVREMIVFAVQNVAQDPPFTRLDLLLCRNLMIYLASDLQGKLIPLFNYSLVPGGLLFLGAAETIGNFKKLFLTLDSKARIYRCVELPASLQRAEFPSLSGRPPQLEHSGMHTHDEHSLAALADRLVLDRLAPATVLVGPEGDIIYIGGHTGPYLEPAAGKANWNIFAMARDGLRYELNSVFAQARTSGEPVTAKGVRADISAGAPLVDITAELIDRPQALQGTTLFSFRTADPQLVVDTVLPDGSAVSQHSAEVVQDLNRARAEIQQVRHEMQASREELQSVNEEMQSSNEELQSTNEELMTSKEEIQSMNEELQTVNQELLAKVNELSKANDDMLNLLNSTEIATVFLDSELRVRRFTEQASQIIRLIPSDEGRALTDLASDLVYPELTDDARRVLRTLAFTEKQVATQDGRWLGVRIMPYRTTDNVIDGVVLTFVDITKSRQLEDELRRLQGQLQGRVDQQGDQLRAAGLDDESAIPAETASAE